MLANAHFVFGDVQFFSLPEVEWNMDSQFSAVQAKINLDYM